MNEFTRSRTREQGRLIVETLLKTLRTKVNDKIDLVKPEISDEYYTSLKTYSHKTLSFIGKLKSDASFIEFLNTLTGIEEYGTTDRNNFIDFIFLSDIAKSFSLVSDLNNLGTKESFALLFLIAKQYGLDENMSCKEVLDLIYSNDYYEKLKTVHQSLVTAVKKNNNQVGYTFRLVGILKNYDSELHKEYLSYIYRFISIVIKADGTVNKEEEDALKQIMKLTDEGGIHYSKEIIIKAPTNNKEETMDELLIELNNLIGLDTVKQEVNTLINYIKIQKERELLGLKASRISYHIVFTGNPGTGKTTVARIMAKIYKSLGVVSKGHFIESDRSGLVAEYLGQTAIKVNKLIDQALDGILFIDEAYSIVGQNNDDYGKEALATLIKRIEDDRNRVILILAGYSDEMKTFIEVNPGLKSRINRYIEFVDYTPEELMSIFEYQCKSLDYFLSDGAKAKLIEIIHSECSIGDKAFGNGRYIRNLFEKVIECQANRLSKIPSLNIELLSTITIEDID